jgi:hypothetical protein
MGLYGEVHEVTELITPGPAKALAGLLGVIRVPCPGEELPASSDGDTVRVSCRDAADRVTATGQIS